MARPEHNEIRALNERGYLTPENLALVAATRNLAETFSTSAASAALSLRDALASTYALLHVFEFRPDDDECAEHDSAGVILAQLGVRADGGVIRRPVLKLVQAIFPSLAPPQHTRYTKVLRFLWPTSEEWDRHDNATPEVWQDVFKKKFDEHGTVRAVLRAKTKADTQKRKAEAEAQARRRTTKGPSPEEVEANIRAMAVKDFYAKARRFSVLSTTDPVEADTIVILRRVPCGQVEAIPLLVATSKLEQLVIEELAARRRGDTLNVEATN